MRHFLTAALLILGLLGSLASCSEAPATQAQDVPDAVHVRLSDDGGYAIEHIVEGDTVDSVLAYVQYQRGALVEKVRRTIDAALERGEMTSEESARLLKRYEQGLSEYTYLSRDD